MREPGEFAKKSAASLLHGKGIFTTIAINGRTPWLWEKHWHRLTSNAKKVGVDISEYEEGSVADLLSDAIAKNELTNGRARITFSDDLPSEIWGGGDAEKKTSLSIITAEHRQVSDHFKLTISPHCTNTTSPLIGIKSCNYLEHILAYEEARARHFDEAIRLNERGEIASGCMANVFWLKDERLFTPSLNTGCLAGTTREYLLENIECEEIRTGIGTLQEADAIYLTSAGVGVVEVREFDRKILGSSVHSILSLMP